MIPAPFPNVQKSSNPLWPVASSSTNHEGDGAASKVGWVAVGGTTPSSAPAMNRLGVVGYGWPPTGPADAIET